MIRHAEMEDIEDILALYESVKGTEMCFWTENYPDRKTIEYDLSREALFLMEDEEENLMAVISLDEDEEVEKLPNWNPELVPVGELSRLAVAPEHQNKGIAKLMLAYGMDELRLRGCGAVHILVHSENLKAKKAYSVFGFSHAGECDLFGAHYDCYEMPI